MPKMHLEQWLEEERKRLVEFEKNWRENNAKTPDMYPMELEPGQWDEMLRAEYGD